MRQCKFYKSTFIYAGFLCLLITFLSTTAWAGWHNPSWNYRKQITIDPSMTPNTDRSWFPALIYKASDAQLAASACTNGEDILFTDSTGTNQLDHEIEDFNSGTGELTAWVEIQTLSSSLPTVIYMYYGNGGCVNQEDVPGTWDEGGSNNFKGVWHLKEEQSGTGTVDLYLDSSGNGSDGDDYISDTGQSGRVNGGKKFDGSNDYIVAPHSAALDITTDLTISAWFRTNIAIPVGTDYDIVSKRNLNNDAYGLRWIAGPQLWFGWYNGGWKGLLLADDGGIVTGQWTYLVGTYNSVTNAISIYKDNGLLNSGTEAVAPLGYNVPLGIGAEGGRPNVGNFSGELDEVRVANAHRTQDWVVTEFNNQSNPSAYLTFGTESAGGDCDIDTAGTYIDVEDNSSLGNGFLSQTGEGIGNGYLLANANDMTPPPGNTPVTYNVNFTQTGVYRIWFRGDSNGSAGDDSYYYGWNGTDQGNGDLYDLAAGYYWSRRWKDYGTNPTSINVTSTGPSTINLWPREDGLKLDGIYLTTGTGVPAGLSGTDPDQYVGGIPDGAKVVDATTCTLSTTTIGDGISPVSRDVWAGGRFFGVDTFTLQTDAGADNLTDLTVTFSGTNVSDIGGSGVKLWKDSGGTNNKWDITDTLISTASFTGNTATFTGFTEPINTTSTQYIITYNIAGTAGVGNNLQGAVTAATVNNTLVNNDTVDATLTVEADSVHETSVYKIGYSPGAFEDVFFKQSSSPTTDLLYSMSLGSDVSTTPGNIIMGWDPDATVTTVINNSVVKQLLMTGRFLDSEGNSYGTNDLTINFYEDRTVLDIDINITTNPGGTDYWFMTYGMWDDGTADETFWWSSNNSGIYNSVNPPPDNTGNQTLPISFQALFELGATDGLLNGTVQNITGYTPAQLKTSDPDSGYVHLVFQKVNPGIGNKHAVVLYSFNTTTSGYDTTITEERQDDSIDPAVLNFGIAGGDGALSGDGFIEVRGAYTLTEGDDDDHVKFQFEPTSTHHAPVFEISGWGAAAPATILVGDSVKTSGTDYNAAVTGGVLYLQYLSNLSSNTVIEIGGDIVSGTLYSDEGTTAVGAGIKVRLLVNGIDKGLDETSGTGQFSFATPLSAADTMLVYVDEDDTDGTTDGTTVTVSDGNNLTGLDVYYQHLIVREDNAGSLSNANMKSAVEPFADTEILYSLDGSNNLTVSGAGTELYVANGHSYTPGANVNTVHVKVLGTVLPGSNTLNVSGNWDSFNGTWWPQTSTVNLTGTGTVAQYMAATPWAYGFYNVSMAAAGQTTTLTSNNLWINYLTTGSGTFTDAANSYAVILQGIGNVFTDGSAALTLNTFQYRAGNYTQNVVGRDYTGIDSLEFNTVGGATGSGVYEIQGNVIANDVEVRINNSPGNTRTSVLNTNNFDLTATNLYIGVNGGMDDYSVLNAGSSTIDINGDVIIYPSDATDDNVINAGSSGWTVSGNWTNNDTFTAGTSSITLDGGDQSITGSTTFNDLTKTESTDNSTDVTLTFDNNATQTINGILTLDGLDDDDRINLVSDNPGNYWEIVLGAIAAKVIDYVDVQDSDASGSDASKKPVDPADSINSGNNVDWFYGLTIVKQVWEEGGTAPLGNPTAPVGATLVFLIYVKNTNASPVSDLRINDDLDEAGFEYVAGSMVRTDAGSPPLDTATDKQIFDATASGTGTGIFDPVDVDVASAQDTGDPGIDVDKITIGAVVGQANASLSMGDHETFALRFKVKVK